VHPLSCFPDAPEESSRSLPARMSKSSWFVGPSCRDVAMFIPGLELLLHIDFHREPRRQGRRRNPRPETHAAPDTHSRTGTPTPRILARLRQEAAAGPPPAAGRATHHLTAGQGQGQGQGRRRLGCAAILPPRAQTGSPGRRPHGHLRLRGRRGTAARQEEAHFTLCGSPVCNCPPGQEPLVTFSSESDRAPSPAAVRKVALELVLASRGLCNT
jgi:hypothetical protein